MRMPPHELVVDAANHLFHAEEILLDGDLVHEDDLEQKVAELLADRRSTAASDCLDELVGLFENEGAKRAHRLLAIPGTTCGASQTSHEREEL